MKTKIILLLFCLMAGGALQAQGQKKEMFRQIAYLQLYIQKAQKGYSTVKKGLKILSDFKDGEFNLHRDYFASLGLVPSALRHHALVEEIMMLHDQTAAQTERARSDLADQDLFHGDEWAYVLRALERLLEESDGDLADLHALLTDDRLVMKDDERLKRLQALHASSVSNYEFAKAFSARIALIGVARTKEGRDVQARRELNTPTP